MLSKCRYIRQKVQQNAISTVIYLLALYYVSLLHIFNNVCICIHNIYSMGFILIRFLEVYIQYKSMKILVAKKFILFQGLET
jgi:hypothetical protein